jgi:hypothetical protein
VNIWSNLHHKATQEKETRNKKKEKEKERKKKKQVRYISTHFHIIICLFVSIHSAPYLLGAILTSFKLKSGVMADNKNFCRGNGTKFVTMSLISTLSEPGNLMELKQDARKYSWNSVFVSSIHHFFSYQDAKIHMQSTYLVIFINNLPTTLFISSNAFGFLEPTQSPPYGTAPLSTTEVPLPPPVKPVLELRCVAEDADCRCGF